MSGTVRKTYKEKLRPTPAQERALDDVLWRCRTLDNTALEQRITAWRRCHVSVTRYQQEAELKDIRAEFPAYAALHSHVLQDVLARLDTTYQAFFRRVASGEQPGFPRFQGRTRWHSFTYKEYGNGARLDNGLPGAVEDRAHRGALVPPAGGHASRPSRSPRRPMGGTSASRVSMCRYGRCQRRGARRVLIWA